MHAILMTTPPRFLLEHKNSSHVFEIYIYYNDHNEQYIYSINEQYDEQYEQYKDHIEQYILPRT